MLLLRCKQTPTRVPFSEFLETGPRRWATDLREGRPSRREDGWKRPNAISPLFRLLQSQRNSLQKILHVAASTPAL